MLHPFTSFLPQDGLDELRHEESLVPRKTPRGNVESISARDNKISCSNFFQDFSDILVADQERALKCVKEVLKALSQNQKRALVLHHLRGMSIEDVAQEMKITPFRVKKLIKEGCVKARKSFDPPRK